jgi:hypothetical protein
MGKSYDEPARGDEFRPPRDDGEPLAVVTDWTKEEEAKAKRK